MNENLNSGYGQAQAGNMPYTTGKVFFVSDSADTANFNDIDKLYVPDQEGVVRRYSTITAALAACVENRGDIIVRSAGFTTLLSAAELLSAETKGVRIQEANVIGSVVSVERLTAPLPATATAAIFNVDGRIRVLGIYGVVTVGLQAIANNLKIAINPSTGSSIDLCAATDVNGNFVNNQYGITGTFTDPLVSVLGSGFVDQASSIIVTSGSICLITTATATGSVKWKLVYEALDAGAIVTPA